jgi:hypothetical protein
VSAEAYDDVGKAMDELDEVNKNIQTVSNHIFKITELAVGRMDKPCGCKLK